MNVNGVDFKLVFILVLIWTHFGMVIELLNMDGERYTVFKLVTEESEMTDRVIKVGVIGAGFMGAMHARIWQQMYGVEVVGVADQIYPAVKR